MTPYGIFHCPYVHKHSHFRFFLMVYCASREHSNHSAKADLSPLCLQRYGIFTKPPNNWENFFVLPGETDGTRVTRFYSR